MAGPATATTVERIARWSLDFGLGDVPAETLGLARNSLLDALGCAIATLGEPCVAPILAYAEAQGGRGEATVIGSGTRLPAPLAALANGVLVRALDLNDHQALDPNDGAKLGGHPSDNLAPVLAVAEREGATGVDLLAAMLVGYELFARVEKLLSPDGPWDHVSAFGISVPAAVARLMGLDAERTAHAIALAAAQSATLGAVRRGRLSEAKFLASALAAERGVTATELAARGVRGPLTVFEEERGLVAGVFAGADPAPLYAPFGGRHMIEGVTIKAHPGMDTSQAATAAAIEAGSRLRAAGAFGAADVRALTLVMNDHPMTRAQATDAERRRPKSRESADHSYHYMAAVALLDGELTPRQFAAGRWSDPGLCALMERIEVRFDPGWAARAPGGFPCRLEVELADGRRAQAEVAYAPGHARNRMTEGDVIAKFRRAVAGRVSDARAGEIVEAVAGLQGAGRVDGLAALLRLTP